MVDIRTPHSLSMERPTPLQFGITDTDITLIAKEKERIKKNSGLFFFKTQCFCILLCNIQSISIALNYSTTATVTTIGILVRIAGGLLIGSFCGFVLSFLPAGLITLGIHDPIVDRSFKKRFPMHESVDRYLNAKTLYESWLARTKREFWLSLSGLAFERELARLFRQMGREVHVTSASNDGGVDIVFTEGDKTVIVQCKAQKKPVGPHAVRDLHGALLHFSADEAILASLSGCTSGVYDYIQDKPITVLSLEDIIKLQDQFGYE